MINCFSVVRIGNFSTPYRGPPLVLFARVERIDGPGPSAALRLSGSDLRFTLVANSLEKFPGAGLNLMAWRTVLRDL